MEPVPSSWKKYLVYAVGAVLLLLIYTWITSPLIVTVTGSGDVSAKAETATLTFTMSSNADTPQVASSSVRSNVNKVKETLKASGIPESDIYESQTSVLPASAVVKDATGFQASTSMGIKTTQIANLDGLINSLYASGAVVVTQPVLSVGNIGALEKQAYDLALKDANSKSWGIAMSNWKLFKKVVLIEQSQTQPTSTVTTKADTASQVEKNISPDDGLIKISKVVSVSYKMW